MRMNSQAPLLIHEVLPDELMAIIFEKHAKLEWRAPAIDGRVCRLWRQIILDTPRVWAYPEMSSRFCERLGISDLLLWLDRSRTAPLHISIDEDFNLSNNMNNRTFYQVLRDYHTRIASLRILADRTSFFDGRDFPCMQHLDIMGGRYGLTSSWPVSRAHMPELRSLRLGYLNRASLFPSLDGLVPLKVLVLYDGKFTSLSHHSSSLVSLMLNKVELGDAISGSLDFPSLTYLSLCAMSDLKPLINAPCLETYHEYSTDTYKSFSAPLHSLVEHGSMGLNPYQLDLTEWHNSFPNILRLSIRAYPHDLISFFDALSIHPHLLPKLQMISVGFYTRFTKKDQGTMEDLVRVRSEASHLDVALYFEPEKPCHIPLFFGGVSH